VTFLSMKLSALSNKVYHFKVYTSQNLYVTKFIRHKVYTSQSSQLQSLLYT
jgi:hypothetical protein